MTIHFRLEQETIETTIHFVDSPEQVMVEPLARHVAIVDKNVVPFFSHSLQQKWNVWLPVQGGEGIKSLDSVTELLHKSHLVLGPKPIFWGIGGGSVLDTVGFLAKIWKRGSPLILFPTTTLSAIDSAHGGKNALNFGNYKNVLGTFHFPKEVWLCRKILEKQKEDVIGDGWAEALKMGLIDSFDLYEQLLKVYPISNFDRWWRVMPQLIRAKYKIIHQDPLETKGKRMVLNLGHTIGHLLEISLGISHGKAVAFGLRFAHEFSLQMGHLKNPIQLPGIPTREELVQLIKNNPKIIQNLISDKKSLSQKHIQFVFISRPGEVKTQPIPTTLVETFWDKLCRE